MSFALIFIPQDILTLTQWWQDKRFHSGHLPKPVTSTNYDKIISKLVKAIEAVADRYYNERCI